MKKFLVTNLWWITLAGALILLIAHTISYDPVKVDHISVILLLVIFLSPFISAIKKIKIGDFEAEIDPIEVQKIRDEVSKVVDTDKAEQLPEIENTIKNIKALVESDPILALAKLRMELEKILNHIYRATHGVGDYFLDSILSDLDSLVLFAGVHPTYFGFHRMLSKRSPFGIYMRWKTT